MSARATIKTGEAIGSVLQQTARSVIKTPEAISTFSQTFVGAAPPQNTVAPSISGTQQVGQTLTSTTGTWTGTGITYSYQWKRNGVSIGGATSSTYVIQNADDGGGVLKCTVTATNGGGSVNADSNSFTIIDFVNASAQIVNTIMGDSKMAYKFDSGTANPTPSVGIAYEYNQGGNSLDVLTQAGLANSGNAGSNKGDPWIQFAIDYNAATSRKPVFTDSHSFGSTAYAATNSNTWYFGSTGGPYTKGTLYTNFKTKTDAALAKAGTQRPIIWIGISINDINNATAITDTTACMDQMIQDLRTDYGTTTPIYINMVGVSNAFPSTRYQAVRSKTIDLQNNYSNVQISLVESLLFSWGLYDSTTTPLHYTQAGNNQMGSICARIITSTETDKDVKRILANMYQPITNSTRLAGVRTLVSGLKSNSYWTLLDTLQVFYGEHTNNLMNDFTGLTAGADGSFGASGDSGVTWTANTKIGGNGTNQHWQSRYAPVLGKYGVLNGASSDYFFMIKTGSVTTPAGTLASLFGGTTGQRVAYFQAVASNIQRNMNNNTPTTYTLKTQVQSNMYITIRTNGATSVISENTTDVDSDAQVPSATTSTGLIDIFARNNANPDTPTERIAAEAYCIVAGKFTGINLGTLQTLLDNFQTSMA